MQINKELIQRYHLGQCSKEEEQIVEQWLESDDVEVSFPEHADLSAMEAKGWKKISSRYHFSDQYTAVNQHPPAAAVNPGLRGYRMVWQLAACLALVVATVVFYVTRNNPIEKGTIAYQQIRADKGQKLTVTLPDGTIVWLNSESSLKYPAKFGAGPRKVEFTGEAYFSVAKDHLHPFIITTARTRIQVLGTKFNVRAYAAEPATAVVVEEGRVSFAGISGKAQLLLTVNQRGIFAVHGKDSTTLVKDNVFAKKYLAWKNNELILDNQNMAQIRGTLERWYNVRINIRSGKLLQERYSGSFSDPSLKQVLESISFAVKCRYKQEGRVYTMY
jgi:transmembrane sensor